MDMIPYIQIRSNSIIVYRLPIQKGAGYRGLRETKKYSGEMKQGSAKRIKRAVDILVQTSPKRKIYNPVIQKEHDFQLGFLTLTIPDNSNITASELHRKCLKPFLRKMRSFGVEKYIWKVERQKRGQLHYHLVINEFIHYYIAQKWWNRYVRRAGLMEKYGIKHGNYNPNSIDIHAITKVKNITAYISKYVSKEVGGEVVGKTWDASNTLKQKYYSEVLDDEGKYCLNQAVGMGKARYFHQKEFELFIMDNPRLLVPPALGWRYGQWLQNV